MQKKLWLIAAAFALPLGGCENPAGPTPSLLSCMFAEPVELEAGEALQVAGAETQGLCLETSGAEYVFVPFHAASRAEAQVAIEVSGAGFVGASGPPSPDLVPSAFAAERALGNEAFHQALRQRELDELGPRLVAGAGAEPQAAPLRAPAVEAVPQVGETLELNVSTECGTSVIRSAQVAWVSDHAIIALDETNPSGGFSASDLEFIAATFDTLIHPTMVSAFGAATDLDANQREILFFTRAVNQLNSAGATSLVGGFHWAGDLFPREGTPRLQPCESSNLAELFYLIAPDPEGAVNGVIIPTEVVREIAIAIVGHEMQHLINASRRLHINEATFLEDVWLNEALSHIGEELLFYASTDLAPRQNFDEALIESHPVAFQRFVRPNLLRLLRYLEKPQQQSLMGADNLSTRGASWAFLRYAADREPGADADLWFRLVNNDAAGLSNLRDALGEDALLWMQDWTVSVYTDDTVVPVEPRFTQPSWNFRSIVPAAADLPSFPLAVLRLASGERVELTLQPGGAAFARFGVGDGLVALHVGVGGSAPKSAVRGSLVRTQ